MAVPILVAAGVAISADRSSTGPGFVRSFLKSKRSESEDWKSDSVVGICV